MQECPRVFVTSSCFYVLTELHYALNSAFMWRCQHLQSTYMDALVKDVKLWLVRVQHVVCFVSSPNHSKNVWLWSPNLGNCACGCIVCWTAQSNPRETAWACVFFFPPMNVFQFCWRVCESSANRIVWIAMNFGGPLWEVFELDDQNVLDERVFCY